MKRSIFTALVLIVIVASAFDLGIKDQRIYGKRYHRNAAQLKTIHQRKHAEAVKIHKNYNPTFDAPVVIDLAIGKSKQPFIVSLESTLDTLWVLDASYPNVSPHIPTFNASNPNSTAVEDGSFYLETTEFVLRGKTYVDLITLWGMERNHTFGSVSEFYSEWLDPEFKGSIAGALGIAWDPLLKDENVTVNSSPIFTIFDAIPYLPRIISQATGNSDKDGSISWAVTGFGVQLDEYYDPKPVAIAPLSFNRETKQLSFKLDSFAFGNTKINGDLAKVDTGSSIIHVSWEAFELVYWTIVPTFDYDIGLYTTPCSNRGKFDDFVFTITGTEFVVPSTSYIVDLGLEKEGQCVVAFLYTSNSASTPFVLGTPFLFQSAVEWMIDDSTIGFYNYLPQTSN